MWTTALLLSGRHYKRDRLTSMMSRTTKPLYGLPMSLRKQRFGHLGKKWDYQRNNTINYSKDETKNIHT